MGVRASVGQWVSGSVVQSVRILVTRIVSCLPGSRAPIADGEHLVLFRQSINGLSERGRTHRLGRVHVSSRARRIWQ